MTRYRRLLLLALVASLAACRSRPASPPSQAASQALAQPVEERVAGTYVHPGTGITFPTQAAGFSREKVIRYDRAGDDVSVGYNFAAPTCAVAATVYVTAASYFDPAANDAGSPQETREAFLRRYFEANKVEIARHHSGARLLSEGAASIQNPVARTGWKAAFAYTELFAQAERPLESQLYVFALGRWLIKYRETYPVACADEGRRRVADLMSALAWPQ
ncbi:MAG TPA: hypothetical protein VFD92_17685 [Candidatus Binatia bacterium]|nr:hypothetical protein [Candidatus Binatia bacterium]